MSFQHTARKLSSFPSCCQHTARKLLSFPPRFQHRDRKLSSFPLRFQKTVRKLSSFPLRFQHTARNILSALQTQPAHFLHSIILLLAHNLNHSLIGHHLRRVTPLPVFRHYEVSAQPATFQLIVISLSTHNNPPPPCQFFFIPLSAHILPLQPIGHLDVSPQLAWCQYLSFCCQHTDYPFLANGHLTVSMQPASVSSLSFRCQHTAYSF
jgi:hypothetical protein